MPPKRRSGAGKKPASRAKGNTVAKCLAAIGVEDAAKTLEGCESLEAEFRVLKSSYHRAVLRAHPDKGGDREVFEDIQNSFEVLRGMFANREVDSFAQAAASRKSTSRAFEFAESTRPKSTPSWEFYAAAAEEPVPIYRVEPPKAGEAGAAWPAAGQTPDASAGRRSRSPRANSASAPSTTSRARTGAGSTSTAGACPRKSTRACPDSARPRLRIRPRSKPRCCP